MSDLRLLFLICAISFATACTSSNSQTGIAAPSAVGEIVSKVPSTAAIGSPVSIRTGTVTPVASPVIVSTSTAVPSRSLEDELSATLLASVKPGPGPEASNARGIEGVGVIPFGLGKDGRQLWIAYSFGMRSFEPLQDHFVTLYTRDGAHWQELDRLYLEYPDYVDRTGVRKVPLEPSHLWLEIEGGMGAHSGTYILLEYDGKTLKNALSNSSSSPGAGQLKDLNGDGMPEVVLNMSENYVFCYACGVRLALYDVLRWDGSQLVTVKLEPLPITSPPELRRLTNRAVELAEAGLWKEASTTISEAERLDAKDKTVMWDAALISLHAKARGEQVTEGTYPILNNVFLGDYDAALKVFRPYSAGQIFSKQTPLVVGTIAEGWEDSLTNWITDTVKLAIQAEPDLAPAYFLRGWALNLSNPGSVEALADIEHAARLDPKDRLYTESVAFLKK